MVNGMGEGGEGGVEMVGYILVSAGFIVKLYHSMHEQRLITNELVKHELTPNACKPINSKLHQ